LQSPPERLHNATAQCCLVTVSSGGVSVSLIRDLRPSHPISLFLGTSPKVREDKTEAQSDLVSLSLEKAPRPTRTSTQPCSVMARWDALSWAKMARAVTHCCVTSGKLSISSWLSIMSVMHSRMFSEIMISAIDFPFEE